MPTLYRGEVMVEVITGDGDITAIITAVSVAAEAVPARVPAALVPAPAREAEGRDAVRRIFTIQGVNKN